MNITILADAEKDYVWSSMPSALTELPSPNSLSGSRYRTKADLTNVTQARLIVGVGSAGSTNAKIRAQYSTDQTTWNYLDGSSGPSVDINTTGLKVSSWINLAAGAHGDRFLRIVGISGDASASPNLGRIDVQAK
jgi:hypothetical protein